eukprot:gene6301-2932_t
MELFSAINNAHARDCTDDGIRELFDASTGLACANGTTNAVDVSNVQRFLGNLPEGLARYAVQSPQSGGRCQILQVRQM